MMQYLISVGRLRVWRGHDANVLDVIADEVQAVALQAHGAVQAGRAHRGVRLVEHSDNFELTNDLIE